jgi:hypothetical protein
MNLDFFAVREDFRRLFEFIWQETDCRVAEGYSLFDQELRWFHFFDELTEAYPIGEDRSGSGNAVSLVLWSPTVMPSYRLERIELDQRRVKGHTHRYSIRGSGFITLIAGGSHGQVVTRSRMGDISEKRALAYGTASGVDWKALGTLGRKIDYHVRKRMAATKTVQSSLPVLPEAYRLFREGAEMREVAGGSWKYDVLPSAAN